MPFVWSDRFDVGKSPVRDGLRGTYNNAVNIELFVSWQKKGETNL